MYQSGFGPHDCPETALGKVVNDLVLGTKTKKMVVDFKRQQGGTLVEKTVRFKYSGVHMTEQLSWSLHIHSTITL